MLQYFRRLPNEIPVKASVWILLLLSTFTVLLCGKLADDISMCQAGDGT